MENEEEGKSGDEFVQLDSEVPQDPLGIGEDGDAGESPAGDNQGADAEAEPNDASNAEPEKKKPRIEDPVNEDDETTPRDGAATAPQTLPVNTQQTPQTSPPQQQTNPMANVAHPMPMMPGMGYSPMAFNPMMMMDPQGYGFNPYHNPNAAAHAGGNASKRGEAKEGEASPQANPAAMNPAMNAAVAAAMMYNPYMMQHFQGMMNSFYPRSFNPNVASNMRKGISLSLSVDGEMLSEYQLLVRQQLELFEAGPEDVESNTQGRKKQVVVGQVGLRCKHCAAFPLRARGRGAVYYPAKLNGIYQAAQNMAGSHLCVSCQQIPPLIKADLQKLRDRRDNASGGKQYWADGCVALGVYETEQGLRLGSRTATDGKSEKEPNKEGTDDLDSPGV